MISGVVQFLPSSCSQTLVLVFRKYGYISIWGHDNQFPIFIYHLSRVCHLQKMPVMTPSSCRSQGTRCCHYQKREGLVIDGLEDGTRSWGGSAGLENRWHYQVPFFSVRSRSRTSRSIPSCALCDRFFPSSVLTARGKKKGAPSLVGGAEKRPIVSHTISERSRGLLQWICRC